MIEIGYKDSSLDFFHELGLFTVSEEGRIYPKSNQAATVVELLTKELFYKKVKVVLDKEVKSIKKQNDMFIVDGEYFDKLLICVGSNAGSNDYNDSLLKSLNLKYNKFSPALVGFKVKEDIKDLFGVRAQATVSLGNHKSRGEVMFKEDGVSGICVMDLSVYQEDEKELSFDFLDDYSFDMLKMIVNRKIKNDPYVHLHNFYASKPSLTNLYHETQTPISPLQNLDMLVCPLYLS